MLSCMRSIPKTGMPAVTRVFRREQVYSVTGLEDVAPDLVIGYAKGTRTSDESAVGGVPPEVIVDNRGAWTGDHCMDPDAVPGILLTTRPLKRPAPTLRRPRPRRARRAWHRRISLNPQGALTCSDRRP